MTWGDVKMSTLRKMFADLSGGLTDEGTREYLAAMPDVANEGLQLLATAGKWLPKRLEIVHNPAQNLLCATGTRRLLGKEVAFAATGANSYYFEAFGTVRLRVKVSGVAVQERVLPGTGVFAPCRGSVDNPGGGVVELALLGEGPAMVRQVALYAERYGEVGDIPCPRDEVEVHLRRLAPDFYRLKEDGVCFEGEVGTEQPTWRFAGDDVLVLPGHMRGSWRVWYYAHPPEMTEATPDGCVLPLSGEAAVLLPLYMASQLYKEDDLALATVYRNEFEVGLERLVGNTALAGHEAFASTSGWV